MANLYVNLENCYGIPKFENLFVFNTDNKAHMIYAPNGIMKTSFANTFSDVCTGQVTKDCFYPERITNRVIKYDSANGNDVLPESILVIEPYAEKYKSDKTSVLLADAVLKEQYDKICNDINEKFLSLSSVLASSSGKRDVENLLTTDFNFNNSDYYNCIEQLYDETFDSTNYDFSEIKYGKIISAEAEKIFEDPDIILQLNSYINEYEKLLTESNVFKPQYNHTSANDTLSTLSKNGFFKANHRLLLDGDTNALDERAFKTIIEAEKKRIIDTKLENEFKKIDDLLSAKAATKSIRDFIFQHKELIPELANYKEFKRKLWISYLIKSADVFQLAVLNYKANKERLLAIIEQARTQASIWNNVVFQFNERFSNMPFELVIDNKEDVVLKSQLPSVSFKYHNRSEEATVDETLLLSHLSNGEKKALYLLNVIFEIEARKKLNTPTFIIMDDIADSFDYRNKYAIIEYMKEICDNSLFMPIILTHNFDFYRTVAGRIGIIPTSNFVTKTETSLVLVHGQYFKNVFDNWRNKVYKNNSIFISSIPFIRNIIEYTKGCEDTDYLNLTSLLHYKPTPATGIISTTNFTVGDLLSIYETHWNRTISKFSQNTSALVLNIILDTANDIMQNTTNEILIENKIVLSIAIRILAEKYMIKRISNPSLTDNITGNQTRVLRDQITFNLHDEQDIKIKEIIERVLIVTSENIHINSFMYEPIVDLSLDELKQLYTDITQNLVLETE